MSDLLTAKDVEVKAFRKAKFGGYAIPEVEDFLNQVAEDIEAYSMQLDEKDARIQELETFVNKQEAMTDAIKDALIQARKAAKDIEDQAKINTEKLIAEAQEEAAQRVEEANKRVAEAEEKASVIISSAEAQAANILQTSQDSREQAEQSRASMEHELESYRLETRQKADSVIDDAQRKAGEIIDDAKRKAGMIIDDAKDEARKMMTDAEREIENYEKQLQFLNLQKQQFVKNTVSLLFDFGKIMDQAQQEIDDEIASMPVGGRVSDVTGDTDPVVNSDTANASEIEEL